MFQGVFLTPLNQSNMAQQKKYFFVQYTRNGKTYYKDQDGKRTSKDKVKKGKRKVYQEASTSIPYTNIQKGDLIDKTKAKAESKKKLPTGTVFNVMNMMIQKEISQIIEKGFALYSRANGGQFQHKSDTSKVNLLLFNFELQGQFYNLFSDLVESPYFFINEIYSVKNKFGLFDWDSISLNPDIDVSSQIEKALKKFRSAKTSLIKKYFKK